MALKLKQERLKIFFYSIKSTKMNRNKQRTQAGSLTYPLWMGVVILALFTFSCQDQVVEEMQPGNQEVTIRAKGGKKPEPTPPPEGSPEIFGVWHAGDDYCTWGSVRSMAEFDEMNHWIIDRGDGRPSVNLVVLSFVNPLTLLHNSTPQDPLGGIPVGMTAEVVQYFKDAGIRVMLSIGGFTYVDDWNAALAENPTQLGLNAARVASELGVGIEIDYEENSGPNLAGLQQFVDAYRSVHEYDETGSNHAARLTIDVAAGSRWLIDLKRYAAIHWLTTDNPVLDYANAMVPARQPRSAQDAIDNWQEHIDGKPQYGPPIPPIAPCKFTGGLYLNGSRTINDECGDFLNSLQYDTGNYVLTASPNGAGTTSGMLGWMFWAAEKPSTRNISTQPPNSCEGGLGVGATFYNVPIPMLPLRQE